MRDFIRKYEFVILFFMGLTFYIYDFFLSPNEFDPTNPGLVVMMIGTIGFVGKKLYSNIKEGGDE
ncbi:hypothetical protein OBA44_01375 [Bacteroidota bacterium]|jgi:hypothetical protein|nr:hypothetical protein [Bacteroidota bacterium]